MSRPLARPDAARDALSSAENALHVALSQLIEKGSGDGHWGGDIRGTADALLALEQCLPFDAFAGLKAAALSWLPAQAERSHVDASTLLGGRRDAGLVELTCWKEEVWDTSVAILALAGAPRNDPDTIRASLAWIRSVFERNGRNWHEEPWETLWAMLALDRCLRLSCADSSSHPDGVACGRAALRWLLEIPRQAGPEHPGKLLSWHYTALFLLVANRWLTDPLLDADEALLPELAHVREELCGALEQGAEVATLWSGELWSNGLALWALAETRDLTLEPGRVQHICRWFAEAVEKSGVPTEDLAFACIGLYQLCVGLAPKGDPSLPPDARLEAALRSRIAARLAGQPDFVRRPPWLTRSDPPGYYTLRAPARWTKLLAIGVVVVAATVLVERSDRLPENARLISRVLAVAITALVTTLELSGRSLPELLRRPRARARRARLSEDADA